MGMIMTKMKNEKIRINEPQDSRFWVHSSELGYGKWVSNNDLKELVLSKTRKDPMVNNYGIKLNETNVKILLQSLDFYARIALGQVDRLRDICSGDVSDTTLAGLQKSMFPELTGLNHSYGICGRDTNEDAKICYDMYKEIRFVFSPVGVYSYKPLHQSKQPKIKFEKLSEKQ